MSVNEVLRNAVLPHVPICEPGNYDGEEAEYCTFVIDDEPDVFAEGMPSVIRYPVILNWYLPSGANPLKKKKSLCRALAAAGFTYPSVTNASDEGGQHFVFECELADGDV